MLLFIVSVFIFLISTFPVHAIYDPLSLPNNKLGVHILHPDEVGLAASFINNKNKASWGYVTVPITLADLDQGKWTKFMNESASQKLIPILRLATMPTNQSWERPKKEDLIAFAVFLDSLPWPIENRYIVIFNEVNRPNEYGDQVDPNHYTDILVEAVDIFKSHSDKYFILPAALDNAAPNANGFIRWDSYLVQMYQHNKEIFNKIDGWNSHSYPNPAFGASPAITGDNKIDSFKSDLEFIKKFTAKKLPVFITETGWSKAILSDQQIADYYKHALVHTWSNLNIVAVTPFLLSANTLPFSNFSLLSQDKSPSLAYLYLQSQATIGSPQLEIYPTPTSIPNSLIAWSNKQENLPQILGVSTATKASKLTVFLSIIKKIIF